MPGEKKRQPSAKVGGNLIHLLGHDDLKSWREGTRATGPTGRFSGAARILWQGGVRYGSIGGLEYEVPQSRLYCLCINVALCSTALQCICHVIRRSSLTMTAHTYYIIFGRPPIGGKLPLLPPGGATAMVAPIWARMVTLSVGLTSILDRRLQERLQDFG